MSKRKREMALADIAVFEAYSAIEFGAAGITFLDDSGAKQTGTLTAESMQKLWRAMTGAVINHI